MSTESLIRQLQAAIRDCEAEFEDERLDFDDDTVLSVEITVGEAKELIDALRTEGT